MRTIIIITFALIIALPITSYATVDYLAANKITKEYYWGDDDHPPGWIGWKSIPEGQLDTAEDDLKKLGYTQTYYPYKIESTIVLTVGILLLGLLFIRRKNINKLYTTTE